MLDKLNRIGIGPRLAGAFLIVALFSLASGGLGLQGMRQAFAAAAVYRQSSEMIARVQDIRLALSALPAPAAAYLAGGGSAQTDRFAAAVVQAREQLEMYAAAHALHQHSAVHSASAHDLIAATQADLDALEDLGGAIFTSADPTAAAERFAALDARAGVAAARLETLLRNAEEDMRAAEVRQAGAERGAAAGLAASALLAVGLAGGLALYSTRRITRPLADLARAADRIAGGDLAGPVPRQATTAPGELGQVAGAFEHMRRTLVREREQVRLLAVLAERDRIGREMHDGLAQVLGFVNAKAQAVREFLRAGQVEQAERNIDELVSAAREAYTEAREAISGLWVEGAAERPLAQLLREQVAKFQRQSGVPAELTVEPGWAEGELPAATRVQLLRVAQEALANVRRHAQASRVQVRLSVEADSLCLAVEDDGRGFYLSHLISPEYAHYGLRTMRERSQAVGGVFRIESLPGKGTRLVVRVPREPPAREAGR